MKVEFWLSSLADFRFEKAHVSRGFEILSGSRARRNEDVDD
jgi:hypothetical protein